MAVTHVNTQTATGNTTSVTATKPTGTAQDDLLTALFVSNNQTATAPAGWTLIADEVVSVFRCQMFYKMAGGSEPANYAFSVDSTAPLVLTVSAWRGVEITDPFDIDPVMVAVTSQSEPYSTPTISGGTGGLVAYFRAARISSGTAVTFTESTAGVSELSDVGATDGSKSYSAALFADDANYVGSGTKTGLAVTASASESQNIAVTWAMQSTNIPGTLETLMPLPEVSASGDVAVPGTMAATMPKVGPVTISAYHGTQEGPLAATVPVSMDVTGAVAPSGPLAISLALDSLAVEIEAETRRFHDNVVIVPIEFRWLVIYQDRIEVTDPGIVPKVGTLEAPVSVGVSIAGSVPVRALLDAANSAQVTALQPTVKVGPKPGHAAVTCRNL